MLLGGKGSESESGPQPAACPSSPAPSSPPARPHQRDDEALRELQEVLPQHCSLHVRRPLPLQALGGGARAEPQQAGCAPFTHRAQLPRPRSTPQRYLKQSSEQGLVSVEVGRVRGVEAWGGGQNGSALPGGGAPPSAVPAHLPAPPRPKACLWVPGGEEGHRPGLVSRVFSLEGFFSLICLGRSPTRHAPWPGLRVLLLPPQAQTRRGPAFPGPLGGGRGPHLASWAPRCGERGASAGAF